MQLNDDGGQAFGGRWVEGLTLRDYFAGQALAGMIAFSTDDRRPVPTAADAYEYADAMLAERAKKREG